jgi:hypothetical protein
VGLQGGPPLREVCRDVHLPGDLRLRGPKGRAVVHRSVRVEGILGRAGLQRDPVELPDEVAIHRRLQHPRRPGGKPGGFVDDVVDLDVIGMAIAPVPVVADHDVGVLPVEQGRQPQASASRVSA